MKKIILLLGILSISLCCFAPLLKNLRVNKDDRWNRCPEPSRPAPSSSYILSFDYACRKDVHLNSCLGEVFWNGQHVARISPNDYSVRSYSV